jgi:hypothetical protein
VASFWLAGTAESAGEVAMRASKASAQAAGGAHFIRDINSPLIPLEFT